jgi:hypothetical protein
MNEMNLSIAEQTWIKTATESQVEAFHAFKSNPEAIKAAVVGNLRKTPKTPFKIADQLTRTLGFVVTAKTVKDCLDRADVISLRDYNLTKDGAVYNLR